MAAAYTKEFLVDAFVSRYKSLPEATVTKLRILAEMDYDKYGKEEFRKHASLDAEAIKTYKAGLN